MPISDAKRRADAKFRKKAYETISIQARRADRLNDLLDIAAARRGISKASYILGAIRDALARDGVTAADLPPVQADEETPARQEHDS